MATETERLATAWRDSILRKTLVSSLIPARPLIMLGHQETVENAEKILSNNNILSAPVINMASSTCWGSVDIVDLIKYVVWLPHTQMGAFPSNTQMKQRFQHPVSSVVAALNQHEFVPVDFDVNIAQILANYFSRLIHRVPVMNNEKRIIGVVSQFDVVRFVYDNIQTSEEFRLIAAKPLFELFDFTKFTAVISVNQRETLMEVFRKIVSHGITGLAVIDNDGKLIGNLSASDFKDFDAMNIQRTNTIRVGSFIRQQKPICCKRTTSLEECLHELIENSVHRIFVVNDEWMPLNVVTLSDLMVLFTSLLSL